MNILEEIQNCPVEWKELGEVALLKRGKTITSKTATDGPYPVISGGQKPAYFNGEFNREGETITIAGSGAYAGFVMYWDEPIFVSDAFSIEPLEGALIPKFLYHYLLEKQEILFSMKKGSGVPHVYPKDVSKILIPIPPLEIQEKIVQKLDKMMEYATELTSELTSRNKQYSYYRDKLLSFEDEVYPVEWKELGDKNVAKLSRGKVMSKQFLEENKGEFPVYSSQTANNGEIGRISSFEYDGEYITWTTDGANAGTVFYRQGKFSITNVCGLVEINNDQLLTKFVYYYLTISAKNHVSSGMGNPKLMSNVMGKIKIPIPPLKIQEEIVQILDNFDRVCNDLNIGLPKEIELRQKQYEYWREQLLNFNK